MACSPKDVYKMDISVPNPVPELLTSSLSEPIGLVLKGTNLYVSEYSNDKITKIDLSESPVAVTTFATGFFLPAGMTLNGNYIYVAESGRVSRIDITQPNPTPETVVSGLSGSRHVAFDGIDMYIAEVVEPSGSAVGKISELQIGQPVFSNIGAVCSGMVTDDLGGASPTGGSYSGPGVTDNADGETFSFNPTVAGGIGNYTVTYTSSNGQTATSTINVIAPPTVTYTPPANISLDAGPLTLSGGMPAGGVYSGPGVSGGNFDPAVAGVGTHILTYTYTAGSGHGCSVSASGSIKVNSPDDACAGATDINNLFTGALNTPVVSTQYDNTGYDAVGDPDNGYECFFTPEVNHTIWYSFTGTGHTYRIRSVECAPNDNYLHDAGAAVYSGDCGNLTPIECNDDENFSNDIFNFRLEVATQAGVNYRLMVDGIPNANFPIFQGKFCLEVTKTALSAVTNIEETGIQLFPNPTTGEIQLRNVQADAVQVHDNMGRLVLTRENPGTSIDISSAPAGVYFLKIMEAGKVYSARVVKE